MGEQNAERGRAQKQANGRKAALGPRTLVMCGYSALVGVVGGLVALGLLALISFLTHLFFYGRVVAAWSFSPPGLSQLHPGAWVILIPPIGGFLVGVMIYFWEPSLKGHGIPEAMEAVLVGHSRIRLRVGFLKPLATALAIGTGGPFGAEGPIIQTGAAFGSLFGQRLKLSPYERRVLLAAGAAAGMAATFLAPMAGLLVAIELLLFEFRARSFIPVTFAAVTGTVVSAAVRGWAPLFPMPAFTLTGMKELWLFLPLGVLAGVIGLCMIRVLSWLEDAFFRLRYKPAAIWAPTLGAFILGVIGWRVPAVLGTGYDVIRQMLAGQIPAAHLLGISFAKFWALVISLGSGTTGGVFAPSLIIGGGVGAGYADLCRRLAPHLVSSPALYSLVAMAAVFGAAARAPFTAILFLFELSRNPNVLLPLLLTCMVADGLVRLLSAESIMTEKLSRRDLVVSQDYVVPVIWRARVWQVMSRDVEGLRQDGPLPDPVWLARQRQRTFPVIEADGRLAGAVSAKVLATAWAQHTPLRNLVTQNFVAVDARDSLEDAIRKLVQARAEEAIVVDGVEAVRPVGMLLPAEMLSLQRQILEEEIPEALGSGFGAANGGDHVPEDVAAAEDQQQSPNAAA